MQVVFYQSGVGSDKNFYSQYVEGMDFSVQVERKILTCVNRNPRMLTR